MGVDMDGVTFSHFWQRWKNEGGNLDFSKFNIETEAALSCKFMKTDHERGPAILPPINYAYQFDAGLYAAYLKKYSEKRGVIRQEGKITQVKQNPTSGHIESVTLESSQEIAGDFFIDCSGFRGLLIEQTLKAGYHDWSHWLPVNRAVAVPCESAGELLPYTRATAQEAGWQWRIPLQHRTGNGYVFCDKFITVDEATTKLMSRLDGAPRAEPRVLKFVTGARKKCWDKNCLAIGLSSGFLEPLESTSIHLVQVTIAKLLTMFPKHGFNESMIRRFNEEMLWEYTDIKDFLIAHYKVTEREDTEFWRYVKHMPIPDSLQEKFDTFRERGEMMVKLSELFKENSWFSVLVGQGFKPEGYHPVADTISDDELRLRLTKIRSGIQNRLNGMPKHADFIRNNCASTMMKSV